MPRTAATVREITTKFDIDEQLKAAAAMARIAFDRLKTLNPGEVVFEFGLEMGGSVLHD